MSSLYIHFPFCLYKCFYCDFNSYAKNFREIPFKEYVLSLLTELKIRKRLFESSGSHFFPPDTSLKTIFFGGGTPSLMSKQDVECILNEVGKYFKFDPDIEITLEANPKTVSDEKLKQLKEAGINRISLGVQSLHDSYLQAYGRIHTANDARKILGDIASAGFKSWNADLIFGFPGQTVDEFEEELTEITSFNMPHLSCYALTVEEATPYHAMIKQGSLTPPDDDLQAILFQRIHPFLQTKGYHRYEVSNFAFPGMECQHNLTYWNYGQYLGLGAGAVSFFHQLWGLASPPPSAKPLESPPLARFARYWEGEKFGYRTTNVKNPEGYMESLLINNSNSPHPPLKLRGGERGRYFFEEELIPKKTAMAEFMMMGLRLKKGVNPKRFFELFGIEVNDIYRQEIIRNRQQKWMQQDHLALTQKGHLFSNQMIASFL